MTLQELSEEKNNELTTNSTRKYNMAKQKDPIIKTICKTIDTDVDNKKSMISKYFVQSESNNRFVFRFWVNQDISGKTLIDLISKYFNREDLNLYSVANIFTNGYIRITIQPL